MRRSRRIQLFLGPASVESERDVSFHINPAAKHPENPVLLPGEPHQWDSLCVSWPGTVLYSRSDRKFRCWYLGMDVVQSPDRTWHTGYAESNDGIHWTKPALGQKPFLGADTNQIAAWETAYYLSCVFENPLPNAPETQRFGGYWTEYRFTEETKDWGKSLWSKSLAWSPDGTHWTRDRTAYGEKTRVPFLDISQVLYDPADPDPAFRWKAYGQIFVPRADGSRPPGVRNIGLAHGPTPDRLQDAANLVVLSPTPGVEEELHFAAVQKIGDRYLMLLESDRFSRSPIHGDLRLADSDDGVHFQRIHLHSPLVATSPKGMWDENLLVTNSAGWQEVGDEIYIYYFGCPAMYNAWPAQYSVSSERRGSMFAPVYLGLATLPRDRFGFVTGEGEVTTRAVELDEDGLWINAEGDGLNIAAIDASGSAAARGTIGNERRQTVYRKVAWAGASPRGTFHIQIALRRGAKLFSIQC